MSRVGESQLVDIINQGTQQILPVPLPESGVSNVPKGKDNSLHAVYKPYEANRKNDNSQYCNFIAPSPRDPLVNVPYLGKGCPYDANAKNAPEGCYLVKSQGTVGFVCKDPNNNANFVRGNQFGVDTLDSDMDVDGLSKSKKAEYTIENPVQLPIQMRNPIVKYDKSTFYPTYLQSFNSMGEYPHAANYDNENIAKGLPTYVYPYKVINPPKDEKDVISLREKFVNQEGDESGKTIIEYQENFSGINASNVDAKYAAVSHRNWAVILIFSILILIMILMLIFCKKIEVGCLLRKFLKR